MNHFVISNKPVNSEKDVYFQGKYLHFKQNYSLKHWDPYYSEKKQVRMFILGRPVIEVDEWGDYDDASSSYITKLLIDKYRNDKLNTFCNELNGTFTIIILDYKINEIIVVTDKAGVYPVYSLKEDFCLSNHLDFLANYLDGKDLDYISIAEFINKGFVYNPNTFYENIKSLENGLVIKYNCKSNDILKYKYYEFKFNTEKNFKLLKKELVRSLKDAIHRRTVNQYGNKACFLSGGGDSRTIMENSLDGKIEAITLYDADSFELKTTKKIAKKLNKKLFLIKRSEYYYLEALQHSVFNSCGMHSFRHDHFMNLRNNDVVTKYDSLLTGCFADWMFKGIALDRKKICLFGFDIPIFKLENFDRHFFGTKSKIANYFFKKILNREDTIYKDKGNHLELESKRIFPLFQEETFTTRLTLQKNFPWDSVFCDNDVLNTYLRIPVRFKVNGELYNMVLKELNLNTNEILHSGKKVKLGTNNYHYVFLRIIAKLKKIFFKTHEDNRGSWIDFKLLLQNNLNVKNSLFHFSEDSKNIVNKILGYDYFDYHKNNLSFCEDFRLFFNVLNFCTWYDNVFTCNKL
jgi:asparagine synthase (glutamine-hydrolysing)